MSLGDRFDGRRRTKDPYDVEFGEDPLYDPIGTPLGEPDDPAATTDEGISGIIGLLKRLLLIKFTIFGNQKDLPATTDTADASLMAFVKRIAAKIPITNDRIDVNADVEIPAIGETTDAPAVSDSGDATLIAITKRISSKIDLSALGDITDTAAIDETEDGSAIAFLKAILGKIPTDVDIAAIGDITDAVATTDTGDATVIALLKRVLTKMGGDTSVTGTPTSGSAQLLTTATSTIIPAPGAGISTYIDKIILSNGTATATLIDIQTSAGILATLQVGANQNQQFDFSGSAIAAGENLAIEAKNRTSTTTFVNVFGYTDTPMSGGGGGGGGTVQLDWVSDGDDNGVFYYRGTNNGPSAWSNPHNSGVISLSASTSFGDIAELVDRQQSANADWYSDNLANQWMQIDLLTYQLIPNRYTLQNTDAYITQNWQFQGSNDAINWTTLDTVTNNNGTSSYDWLSRTITTTTNFRYFRILMNGFDSNGGQYLTFSEIELYGTLSLI